MTHHRLRLHVRVPLMLLALAVSSRATALPIRFQRVGGRQRPLQPDRNAVRSGRPPLRCRANGQLRVIKNGIAAAAAFLTRDRRLAGERGLLGVAFDPAFATNRFVYVYYTATTPGSQSGQPLHRQWRRRCRRQRGRDLRSRQSEQGDEPQRRRAAFGPDGKLYVAVGENANGANSQTLNNRARQDPPHQHPTAQSRPTIHSSHSRPARIARSGRSAFATRSHSRSTRSEPRCSSTMSVRTPGKRSTRRGRRQLRLAGYGGCDDNPKFSRPLYAYIHAAGACAITGGAFYNPGHISFPPTTSATISSRILRGLDQETR